MVPNPRRKSNEPPRQATEAPQSNVGPGSSQLDKWSRKQETHEQMVVGQRTSRTFAKTLGFLEEMEKRVGGDGREGGSNRG